MQNHRTSTHLRQRLSLPPYQPADSGCDEFVETIREALGNRKTPEAGSKRHRFLFSRDNWASALRNMIDEVLDKAESAGVPRIQELEARISRAIRTHLKRRFPQLAHSPNWKMAIVAETASNGLQNEHSNAVLISGTLGEVERLWESSRVQRDMSQLVMESCEDRIAELKAAAR